MRPGLAALITLVGFLLLLGTVLAAVGTSIASEADQIGPTISEGIDDVDRLARGGLAVRRLAVRRGSDP